LAGGSSASNRISRSDMTSFLLAPEPRPPRLARASSPASRAPDAGAGGAPPA
jgi:hypothetical protein